MKPIGDIFDQYVQDLVRQHVERELTARLAELELTAPERMTTTQVARYLGKEKGTIRNWVGQGKIPAHRDGMGLFFLRSEVDAYSAWSRARLERGESATVAEWEASRNPSGSVKNPSGSVKNPARKK